MTEQDSPSPSTPTTSTTPSSSLSAEEKARKRREARRQKIMAGGQDRLGKIVQTFTGGSDNTTESEEKKESGEETAKSDVTTTSTTNVTATVESKDTNTSDKTEKTQPESVTEEKTNGKERGRSQSPSKEQPKPKSEPKSKSRSPVRPVPTTTTTTSSTTTTTTPPTTEPTSTLRNRAHPSNTLPTLPILSDIPSTDRDKITAMMQELYSTSATSSSSSLPSLPPSALDALNTSSTDSSLPPDSESTKPSISVSSIEQTYKWWRLLHFISVILLAVYCLLHLISRVNFIENPTEDDDIEELEVSGLRVLKSMTLGKITTETFIGEYGLSVWWTFLTMELILHTTRMIYEKYFTSTTSPSSMPSLPSWLMLDPRLMTNPTLIEIIKALSAYKMVWKTLLDDIYLFVFVIGVGVGVGCVVG